MIEFLVVVLQLSRVGVEVPPRMEVDEEATAMLSPERPEAETSDAVITGIIPVCHRPASVLFDPGSTFSYVSTYFVAKFDMICDSMTVPIRAISGGSSVSILSCFFGWV